MRGDDLYEHIKRTCSALFAASGMLHPNILQAIHRTAIRATPELAGRNIHTPHDAPTTNMVLGTKMKPSEAVSAIENEVVPFVLVSVQSIAEESLNAACDMRVSVRRLIEDSVTNGLIERGAASDLHHWRLVRNAIVHEGGTIGEETDKEFRRLRAESKVSFAEFTLHRDIHKHSVGNNPERRDPVQVPCTQGSKLSPCLGDILGAADSWAGLMRAHGL